MIFLIHITDLVNAYAKKKIRVEVFPVYEKAWLVMGQW